jgi:hypothetical protein
MFDKLKMPESCKECPIENCEDREHYKCCHTCENTWKKLNEFFDVQCLQCNQ